MHLVNNTHTRSAVDHALLISKNYPQNSPRYTSYPTAHEFSEKIKNKDFETCLSESNNALIPDNLSLYLHLPFCRFLCFYCGCNRIVTKNRDKGKKYLDYLEREIALVGHHIDTDRKVDQLHLGGGTPTFYDIGQLDRILTTLGQHFAMDLSDDREFSIEIDPRTVDEKTIHGLFALGFNRLSMGVQDFDPKVQEAIHRIQTKESVGALTRAARDTGFASINYDLVYGLPHQTVQSFSNTIQKVVDFGPDRISIFQYAHLPGMFPAQRRIQDEWLPDNQRRMDLLQSARDMLESAGYIHIGLDHFSRPEDPLALAHASGNLTRNFQGYSASEHHETVGMGVSAISDVGGGIFQNAKTLEDYYAALDKHEIPVARGVIRHVDDEIRRQVITEIMCNGRIDKLQFQSIAGVSFNNYFSHESKTLSQLESDGAISQTEFELSVTDCGQHLLRTIARTFDVYRRSPSRHQELSASN